MLQCHVKRNCWKTTTFISNCILRGVFKNLLNFLHICIKKIYFFINLHLWMFVEFNTVVHWGSAFFLNTYMVIIYMIKRGRSSCQDTAFQKHNGCFLTIFSELMSDEVRIKPERFLEDRFLDNLLLPWKPAQTWLSFLLCLEV